MLVPQRSACDPWEMQEGAAQRVVEVADEASPSELSHNACVCVTAAEVASSEC